MSSPENRPRAAEDYRSPTEVELHLLATLLSADFVGAAALRAQCQEALVRQIDDDGSLSIIVDQPSPAEVTRRVPVEAEISDEDGVLIHILLHIIDGYLHELEIYREDSDRVRRTIAPEALNLIVL
jgi:hypothetical protein